MSANRRMNWDDLRYVLAVAEANSLAGAARLLQVNHTTVLRRIAAVEVQLGTRLFDRLPSGYALTAGGEELLSAARLMSETVTSLERKLAGQDARVEGMLRVTTTDTLAVSLMPKLLSEFQAAYPDVLVELISENAFANLTKRDADIAIRPATDPPEMLFGRRIASIAFSIYASARSGNQHSTSTRLSELGESSWVGLDDSLSSSAAARWMHAHVPSDRISIHCNSLVTVAKAAETGIGLAVLPCYLGDLTDGLVRVGEPIDKLISALWILTHEDLKHTARVNAFMQFAGQRLGSRRALLEGREPR